MTIALAAAFALLSVAFFLLARLLTENQRLTRARSATAQRIRRLRQQRDAYAECLRESGDEYEELGARCEELESELKAYRAEDVRRVVQERVWS